MILLSAQPDENYFIWQLEIQLINFKEFGIASDSIHILVAYQEEKGINKSFLRFSEDYREYGTFYYYPDKRKCQDYISSVRPHIIAQHYNQFPQLGDEVIFYHDSDIIFTNALPDFDRLSKGDTWYVSDARSYLDSTYINSKGPNVLQEMCDVINIDPALVILNDPNAGGAQAVIKKVDAAFWLGLERDSVRLFNHLRTNEPRFRNEYLNSTSNHHKRKYVPIASWCTDMWVLLWSAFKNQVVKIDGELDFCWPLDHVDSWNQKRIFHNAGVDLGSKNRYFYKGMYKSFNPYDHNFDFISKSSCSFKYAQKITEISQIKKYDSSSVTFLVFSDQAERDNIDLSVKYLTNIFGENSSIVPFRDSSRQEGCKVVLKDFLFSQRFELNRPHICLYNADLLTGPVHISNCLYNVQDGLSDLSISFGYYFNDISKVLLDDFRENLQIQNINKFHGENDSTFSDDISTLIISKKALVPLVNGEAHIKSIHFLIKEIILNSNKSGRSVHKENSQDLKKTAHISKKRNAHLTQLDDDYIAYVKLFTV